MKIIVTGSNGQLGNELRLLAPDYPDFNFIFTDVAELDITRETDVDLFVKTEHPSVIINCAAYTAVDKAETEPHAAFLINTTAVGILARVASQYNALLVHLSTDYVFDGTAFMPYRENDRTNPVSVYAKSKNGGELQVQSFSKNALVIRTSWLYSEFGNNFVKTMMKLGKERGRLNVVCDQVGTPTYARDLAKALLAILHSGQEIKGVDFFHYANEGAASWYDFAKAIIGFSGINCIINPIETKDYPTPASRPCYSIFNKTKIKQRFGLEIPFWQDSLRECVAKICGT
jgi:dTDP-4-dehydrorhamnose reductase